MWLLDIQNIPLAGLLYPLSASDTTSSTPPLPSKLARFTLRIACSQLKVRVALRLRTVSHDFPGQTMNRRTNRRNKIAIENWTPLIRRCFLPSTSFRTFQCLWKSNRGSPNPHWVKQVAAVIGWAKRKNDKTCLDWKKCLKPWGADSMVRSMGPLSPCQRGRARLDTWSAIKQKEYENRSKPQIQTWKCGFTGHNLGGPSMLQLGASPERKVSAAAPQVPNGQPNTIKANSEATPQTFPPKMSSFRKSEKQNYWGCHAGWCCSRGRTSTTSLLRSGRTKISILILTWSEKQTIRLQAWKIYQIMNSASSMKNQLFLNVYEEFRLRHMSFVLSTTMP